MKNETTKTYRLLNAHCTRKNKNKRYVVGFENLQALADRAGYSDIYRQHLTGCHPCYCGTLHGKSADGSDVEMPGAPFAIELTDEEAAMAC